MLKCSVGGQVVLSAPMAMIIVNAIIEIYGFLCKLYGEFIKKIISITIILLQMLRKIVLIVRKHILNPWIKTP